MNSHMKRIVSLIPFLLSNFLFAQGTVTVNISVHDSKQKALSGTTVSLIETSSNERLEKKADAMGKVQFTLDHGQVWKLFVNDFDMDREIDVPEQGRSTRNMALNYNPDFANRKAMQTVDRYNFTWQEQHLTGKEAPAAGKAMVRIKVKSRTGYTQKGVLVRVLIPATKSGFMATTDVSGMASFMLDLGTSYDIDVEDVLNISYVDVKNREGMVLTSTVQYDKPKISETAYGDTIVQRILKEEAASGRALYSITVHKAGKGIGSNETVYLEEIHGKKVYVGYTNEAGEVKFLLPIGMKYMIHFNFERDVDVVDLSKVFGYVNGGMELVYRPNPKREHPELFIPSKEELFLLEFEQFLSEQYPAPLAPNKVGLFLKWGNTFNAQSKEALLEIGYTAKGEGIEMPGNYSFILDRSGSMAGYYRIEMLKKSLIALVAKLSPNDYVSVFAFDDAMQVIFPHQKLGNKKQELIKAIEAIEAGGGTDMLAAMKAGYEAVMSRYSPKQNNRVILLSDGYDSNQPEVLLDAQKPYNNKILCTSVGVGEDYNYSLMKLLAEKGSGVLYHVADSAAFMEVFLKQVLNEMQPVAYDVRLEVHFNEALQCEHLYGRTPLPGSKNPLKYSIPNLYNGANEVALALFQLKRSNPEITKQPIKVRIIYKEKLDGPDIIVEQSIAPEWQDGNGQLKLAVEAQQKKLYAIAEMNRALKGMSDAYTEGDNKRAQEVLEQTITRMKVLYPKADDADVKKVMDSMEGYLEAFKNLARKNALKPKMGG